MIAIFLKESESQSRQHKSELPVLWTVVASVRSTPHHGTKISRPAELKVAGTGSKFFLSGSLGVTVNGTISFSIPCFLELCILAMGETVPYIGC